MDYERRHGYRGPEGFVNLPANADDRDQAIDDALVDHPDNGEMVAAVVTAANAKAGEGEFVDGDTVATIAGDSLRFAARALCAAARRPTQRIKAGLDRAPDEGREGQLAHHAIAAGGRRARLARAAGRRDPCARRRLRLQQEQVQPRDAGMAPAGFELQAVHLFGGARQGLGPATIINDAPLYFPPTTPGGQAWEPKDDDAARRPDVDAHRRCSVEEPRVDPHPVDIGTKYAQDFVTKNFGFDADKPPPYLPMALGAGLVTPLQLSGAYSVFANGGYRINPYLIADVTDARGTVISRIRSR